MESDIIGHLVDVEHKASTLVDNAKKEAQTRLDKAKVKAEKQYLEEYKKVIEELEREYVLKTNSLTKIHQDTIQAYKEKIGALGQDRKAFNNLLDKLLLGA
ncbi:MAG: hypothetical protein BKP49_04880 [Treponema sp. CETP13]|nr:MAG: hypothetical protein BKP49_04880 [Treponema sp. CETP13]